MRYKKLGRTGLNVSEISLGTWGIGGSGWDDSTEEDSLNAIAAMLDFGVNFIDTAPAYNAGVAEQIIGKAVKQVRDKTVLVTKVGTAFVNGAYVRDNSKKMVFEQCEQSLKNLQTDYIDVYMIHWPDANTPIEETMEALAKLKEQKKIRYIGVSNFSVEQINQAEQFGDIDVVQCQYSMVNRKAEPLVRWAAENGKGVMTYGSLGAGILTGAYRTLPTFDPSDNRSRFYQHFKEPMFSKVMELLKTLDTISDEHGGIALSQIALNWNTQKPFISSSICGVQFPHHAAENCDCMNWMLSDSEIARIDSAIVAALGNDE